MLPFLLNRQPYLKDFRRLLIFEVLIHNLMAGSSEPPELFDLAKNYQVCFGSAVREFVHGIRSGSAFPTDGLDNLETLKLMESCYLSAGVKC